MTYETIENEDQGKAGIGLWGCACATTICECLPAFLRCPL
jgi:hypothetical protein